MAVSDDSSSSPQSKQEHLHQQQQQQQQQLEEEQELQRLRENALRRAVNNYPVQLAWPAIVATGGGDRHKHRIRRTSSELIQHRLLEAGILYEVPTPLSQVSEAATRFINDLEQTQCFKAVHVEIGNHHEANTDNKDEQEIKDKEKLRNITVHLKEANWYRLHVGGGVKTASLVGDQPSSSFLPTPELECSIGLRNLSGNLDTSTLQYSLDSHSIASLRLHHQRPLFTITPLYLSEWILSQSTGSQMRFEVQAGVDTVDHNWTRSYREFQRILSLKLIFMPNLNLAWSMLGRDLIPQRHTTIPYSFAASDEVVASASPNVRHALTLEYNSSSQSEKRHDHTGGTNVSGKVQLATPPGDVGFLKLEGGVQTQFTPFHSPSSIQLHSSFKFGYLKNLDFGGLCPSRCLSDRFFVGGPLQLRGFGFSGIGPRAAPTPYTTGPGDSLGGDFFYTGTLLASIPTNLFNPSRQDKDSFLSSMRLFGFVNVGTCIGHLSTTPVSAVLQSTRASFGAGVSCTALGPMRFEMTYALPLRYGPRDVRTAFQIGMGLSV